LADGLLTAGLSKADGHIDPCQIPPPVQIAFISNLVVHPKHTSRADKPDRAEVAYLAGNYLDNLLQTVGPIKAKFNEAFQFNPNYQPRIMRAMSGDDPFHDEDEQHVVGNANAPVQGKLGGQQLLWNSGSDFWSVVGWAFNCAVLYPARWRWWREWLDYMLRVLWEDWKARLLADCDANAKRGEDEVHVYAMMNKSLLTSYVSLYKIRRDHGLKHIIQALFADGHTASQSRFTEVFPRETQEPPKGQNKRKREVKLDLDNMQYGDYCDSDDDFDADDNPPTSAASTPVKLGRGTTQHCQELTKFEHYATNAEALHDTMSFRLRIIELLTQVSNALPHLFVTQDSLYQDLAEAIRHLPLPMFEALFKVDRNPLNGTLRYIGVEKGDLSFLISELLHWFLPPKKHLDPAAVDPEADEAELLTWDILARCYLLHAAPSASVEDNAKLSVLLENAIMLLMAESNGVIPDSEPLYQSLARGIEARNKKAKVRKGRNGKVDKQEMVAKERLDKSTQLLKMILAHMETEGKIVVAHNG